MTPLLVRQVIFIALGMASVNSVNLSNRGKVISLLKLKILPCLNDCSSQLNGDRGTCISGVCICNSGFGGEDCSVGNAASTISSSLSIADKNMSTLLNQTAESRPKVLTQSNQPTCDPDDCLRLCFYGGSCNTNKDTCICRNRLPVKSKLWGKRPSLVDPITFNGVIQGIVDDPVSPMRSQRALVLEERSLLHDICISLGVPMGKGDPCSGSWRGIICDSEGHLVEIDFSRRHLTGRFPEAVTRLKYLRNLYLHNNMLSGRISDRIGHMSALTTLMLYRNRLSGPIPETITNCKALTYVVMYGNLLSGRIPQTLGEMHANLRFVKYLCSSWLHMAESLHAVFPIMICLHNFLF